MSVEKIYTLPDQKATSAGQMMIQTVVVLLSITVLAIWAATQYVAWKLGFQPALGDPLFRLGSFALYSPFDFFIWLLRYGHVVETESAFRGGEWILTSLHFLFVPAIWLSIRRGRKFNKKTDTHGSAHFADADEIKATGLLPKNSDGHDVYVGVITDPKTGKKTYLRDSGSSHICTGAPTGSGKGVGVVNPTILSWIGSIIAYDMKKELWALSAGFRKALGQVVMRFEPTCMDGSGARFNPLEEVRLRTLREVADAQNIAEMIVDPDGKGMDDHWAKTGHELLSAAILHVLYVEPNKTLRGVVSFFCDPRRSIEQVAESMLNAHHDLDATQNWSDPMTGRRTLTHPVVAEAARSFLNKSDNERSGVQSTALSFLSLYRDPVVAMNTAVSDFRIADLMNHEKPVSLYLVVPPSDRKRLRPLIRLMFNLVLRNLTESMDYKDGKQVQHYKHRLLMIMDEVPSLGKLEILEESIAFVRSYGIKILLIFQDYAQLYKAYTKEESLTSNTHITVMFTPNKIDTAKIISDRLGQKTVQRETRSYSGHRLNPLPMHVMGAINETGRPLLQPAEVMRIPAPVKSEDGKRILTPGDLLIFVMGHAPIYAQQILFYEEPLWLKRSQIPMPAESDRIIDNPREIVIAPDPIDDVPVLELDDRDGDELEEGLSNEVHAPAAPTTAAESAQVRVSKIRSGLRPASNRRQAADGRNYTIDHDTGEVVYDNPPAPGAMTEEGAAPIVYTPEQLAAIEAEEAALMESRESTPRIGAQEGEHGA
ncbi:type IV secretory system conjugative DNA transfer family protein [Burkholderia vietnamiensis]|uniref:type IV secretory system conjugative DNA transfer family protein n=1 Tax=Burkholderia vietnamiensis TaxID=60552 RepID=UPI0015938756|nr:type IV secretory system conjugative DNA transfer family protein [Burkholderia vietnamiensis]MCA8270700.1 type IV secretory system conjugative DNA transfer family protein [Burkholderia vietnamiensis]